MRSYPEGITLVVGCILAVACSVWISRWERRIEHDHLNADAETRVAAIKYEIDTELQKLAQRSAELAERRGGAQAERLVDGAYVWIDGSGAGGGPQDAPAGIEQVLARARDRGAPAVSRRFSASGGASSWRVLAVAPVYGRGGPASVEERRRRLRGYAATLLDPAELLERSSHYPHADRMTVQLSDRKAQPGEAFLAYHRPARSGKRNANAAAAELRSAEYVVRIPVGDREWEVACAGMGPLGGFGFGWQAWGALLVGLALAIAIAALVHLLTTRTHRVEQLVEQRTRELEANNQKLVEAHARALESSRLKSQFLANMSHEIRTPMNGIIGFTQLALGTTLSSDQREYLETVESSAELMMQIINDILDFSKIEAGRLEMEHAPFSLRACLKLAADAMMVAATQKGLELSWTVEEECPDTVLGDGFRLRQVLLNLIGNSVKFTSTGSVRLTASASPASETELTVHFTVRDTGIGIPMSVQRLIFEPFRQADGSTTRKYGGTGLGLAISARLVEMMGGRIWVESREGEGSTFHFDVRLDLSPTASLPRKAAALATPRRCTECPLRILLAEDNVVSRELVTALLRHPGHEVELANNGREAVELYEPGRYDLILMDVQMPEMDGLEATARIRAKELAAGVHTPVVALTAHAMSGDRDRCLAAGMDDYLSKPVRAGELLALITGVAAKRGAVQKR
jgi:signal transduction histidine kinase/CheY-like chemotaxis protein